MQNKNCSVMATDFVQASLNEWLFFSEIWMVLTSSYFNSTIGTVTMRTPFFMEALTWSIFAFSSNLNRLENLSMLRSTRCYISFFSSFSTFLLPLIWSTISYSISSFLCPERSTSNTRHPTSLSSRCECWSRPNFLKKVIQNSWKVMANGSKILVRRLTKKLRMKDIFFPFQILGFAFRCVGEFEN